MYETKALTPKSIPMLRIFVTTKKKIAAMLNLDSRTFYFIRIGLFEPGETLAEGLEKVTGISKSDWIAPGRRWHLDKKLKALFAKEKVEEMNFIIGKGFSRKGITHISYPIQRPMCEISFSL